MHIFGPGISTNESLSIYLSIFYLSFFIYLSIHPFLSLNLSVYISIYILYIYIYLYIYISIYIYIYLCIFIDISNGSSGWLMMVLNEWILANGPREAPIIIWDKKPLIRANKADKNRFFMN